MAMLVPRPAATLILVRDGLQGIEVFMMQRTHQADFLGGAYVFPGGGVDPDDNLERTAAECAGLDDATASRTLGVESGGLAYWVAAVRECFEESGLLLACDETGELCGAREAVGPDQLAALRNRLAAGELSFIDSCRSLGVRPALDRLVYFGHWITPMGRPRRYDTRFFLAVAPALQVASPDHSETIDHVWIRPADAVAGRREGKLSLAFATVSTLRELTAFNDSASLMAHARDRKSIMARAPRVSTGDGGGRRVLLPQDPAYAEIGKLDPDGKGDGWSEIVPGTVTRLSDKVRRITAPNPSYMTGPGTNTYLLGTGKELAIIDPGPALDVHIEALLAETQGRIRWILVTHTHMDHSPAARLLRARTGAQLLGMAPPPHERQDQSFLPDRILADGERIEVAGCAIRVIQTPGHASNHLCYLLEDERMLFTGDHVMQGSTVVINPPDGDMTDYLASLEKLLDEDIAWLAPGHGFLMDQARERIERLVRHRLAREAKVAAALGTLGAASLPDLVAAVYDDVPPHKHPAASRSLLAHLLRLQAQGHASERDGRWQAANAMHGAGERT
jgi:glyoxylase-like metal-dependent hydrolase (beta-lactamase superfamily II)/8-oxo-dGTP pyrophosphatase MutT (NUDIX family)